MEHADTDLILIDPSILDGKPVIRGTRPSVEFIIEQPGFLFRKYLMNIQNLVHNRDYQTRF